MYSWFLMFHIHIFFTWERTSVECETFLSPDGCDIVFKKFNLIISSKVESYPRKCLFTVYTISFHVTLIVILNVYIYLLYASFMSWTHKNIYLLKTSTYNNCTLKSISNFQSKISNVHKSILDHQYTELNISKKKKFLLIYSKNRNYNLCMTHQTWE